MRLLRWIDQSRVSLTKDLDDNEWPPYAILSHTWSRDSREEISFAEVDTEEGRKRPGYGKIRFCAQQAKKDGINHFWIDTCCIDRTNHVELSEAITSMYRWYQNAVKCYVYLSDVSAQQEGKVQSSGELSFRASRWFTRGWTLQELLAPKTVEFFSLEGAFLGDKNTLAHQIHAITSIPLDALRAISLSQFPVEERMRWTTSRRTKKPEDRAYSLLGIFDVSIAVIYGEGEKRAFHRLQKAIQEQSGIAPLPANSYWSVPRTANPIFTGRHHLLQELEETVRDAVHCPWNRAQCQIVIYGLGGQGKSEICLQLVRRLRPIFQAVLWIDVSTIDNAERSFLEAAQNLSLPAQTWDQAVSSLSNIRYPCLLVLDNADDPEVDYRDYLPDNPYMVILMTTRNKECEQYSTNRTIALEALEMSEAQDLLLKAARTPSDQHDRFAADACRVAGLLQFHPLALVQAGAYVARGHCTLAEYPVVYEIQRQRLLTFRNSQARSRYRDVYATFEVSADMLNQMNTSTSQDALQLLPVLAVCGPRRVPLWLFEVAWRLARRLPNEFDYSTEDESDQRFTPWHIAQLPVVCDVSCETWDSYRLMEAVALLEAFSLVSTDRSTDQIYLSFHALVHAWARDRQNQLQRQRAWLQMGCVIAFNLARPDSWTELDRQLRPHVEALLDWDVYGIFMMGPKVSIARILVVCGYSLYRQHANAKLATLLDEIFTALGLNRSTIEQRWIGLYRLAAGNHHNRGGVREAIGLLEGIVKIEEMTLPDDDGMRLFSQYKLATAYINSKQIDEAVVLLEAIIQVEERKSASNHPDLLRAQHALATAYMNNGRIGEAVVLLEGIVKIKGRTMGDGNVDLLKSRYELSRAYLDTKRTAEALALIEAVVRIEEQTMAEDHPILLCSQHQLARCLWETGEKEAAISLMAQVVSIEKTVLDEHHFNRLASEGWLAYFEQHMANTTPS